MAAKYPEGLLSIWEILENHRMVYKALFEITFKLYIFLKKLENKFLLEKFYLSFNDLIIYDQEDLLNY